MSGRETADDYDRVVAVLNENWRVIECPDQIQWILQCRGSPTRSRKDDWRGRSYCRTSEALLRCTRRHAGSVNTSAMQELVALPDRIAKVVSTPTSQRHLTSLSTSSPLTRAGADYSSPSNGEAASGTTLLADEVGAPKAANWR